MPCTVTISFWSFCGHTQEARHNCSLASEPSLTTLLLGLIIPRPCSYTPDKHVFVDGRCKECKLRRSPRRYKMEKLRARRPSDMYMCQRQAPQDCIRDQKVMLARLAYHQQWLMDVEAHRVKEEQDGVDSEDQLYAYDPVRFDEEDNFLAKSGFEDMEECLYCHRQHDHHDDVHRLPCGDTFHFGCITSHFDGGLTSECPHCKHWFRLVQPPRNIPLDMSTIKQVSWRRFG